MTGENRRHRTDPGDLADSFIWTALNPVFVSLVEALVRELEGLPMDVAYLFGS